MRKISILRIFTCKRLRVDYINSPQPGEYVMVHAGFAIERLPEEQALEDLGEWEALRAVMQDG